MLRYEMFSRRRFLQGTAALAVTRPWRVMGSDATSASLAGRLYKTLKIGMADVPGSLTDKFGAVKAAGFQGVEMDSPGMDVEETRRAIVGSGLPVDGTVCSTHWSVRHTSPDAAQRAQALGDLQAALRDTHAVGGHTVLLVVGHGQDGPEQDIWPRSIENIAKAVPLAAELGVVDRHRKCLEPLPLRSRWGRRPDSG